MRTLTCPIFFFYSKQNRAVNSCIPVDPSTWWIGNLPWGKSYLLDKHQAMKATEYSIPTSWSTSQVWLEKVIRGTSWEAMRLRDVPLRYRCGTITPSLSPSSSSRTAKHHQMVLKPVFLLFCFFQERVLQSTDGLCSGSTSSFWYWHLFS